MATIRLTGPRQREEAKRQIDAAPDGWVCKLGEETRRDAQNKMLWACLADISKAMPLGRRHTPDEWKILFMNACGWEVQFIEGLDGRPFPQGFRSSRMTVKQMADLITYILAFGAENGVRWSDPQG
jgi:hypothetical protein